VLGTFLGTFSVPLPRDPDDEERRHAEAEGHADHQGGVGQLEREPAEGDLLADRGQPVEGAGDPEDAELAPSEQRGLEEGHGRSCYPVPDAAVQHACPGAIRAKMTGARPPIRRADRRA